jgi:Rho termination factor, N-terminal domain
VTTRTQAALLDAVDRAFDLAEKTLAAQRELARTLVGAAERQADAVAETVESTSRETLREVHDTVQAEAERAQRVVERVEQAPAPKPGKPEADKPKPRRQEPKVDRRPFEERSLEELRERARELDIEGRSAMSKDELVAALRKQGK